MTTTVKLCPHGHEEAGEFAFATFDDDDRTACCDAYFTYSGDGWAYCKCCWNPVVSTGDELAGIVPHQHEGV